MSFLGIELNDSEIIGVTDAGIVFSEPGCALVEAGKAEFGKDARSAAYRHPRAFHDRYWCDLSEQPVVTGSDTLQTCADLAHAQLAKLWATAGAGVEQVAYAVPSYWSRDQLALLLGISQELGIPLTGLVEMPVAATRRPYPDYELLHIESSAHAISVSRMSSDAAEITAHIDTVTDVGVIALRRVCAEYFARRFLECSRFDPLHDAQSEQGIYDCLDEWLAALDSSAVVADIQIEYKSNVYAAKIDKEGLALRLRQRCQTLIQALRSTVSIDRPTALQIDAQLARYPGVVEMLLELPGCDVFVLEPGAAARGLLMRRENLLNGAATSDAGFSVSSRLPLDQPPAEVVGHVASAETARLPTHLLYAGTAYRLGALPFHIGTELDKSDYGIAVAAQHTGVSRQHCSIELADGRVRLNDHSRYGTLLNGRRLDESAVLQAGDVISLGDPACNFQLIAEAGPDGA
jgi:hypothetical protein